MNNWIIHPLISVGKIEIGMKREAVRSLFQNRYVEFKKTKYSNNTTDDFGQFHVYYTVDNKVDAVEVFEGIQMTLDGKIIFPIKTNDIPAAIPGIQKQGNSYTHTGKSIAVEASSSVAESILVGSAGYFG